MSFHQGTNVALGQKHYPGENNQAFNSFISELITLMKFMKSPPNQKKKSGCASGDTKKMNSTFWFYFFATQQSKWVKMCMMSSHKNAWLKFIVSPLKEKKAHVLLNILKNLKIYKNYADFETFLPFRMISLWKLWKLKEHFAKKWEKSKCISESSKARYAFQYFLHCF